MSISSLIGVSEVPADRTAAAHCTQGTEADMDHTMATKLKCESANLESDNPTRDTSKNR